MTDLTDDLVVQVLPLGIEVLDQYNFPGSLPFLKAFFSFDSFFHGFMNFIINQVLDPVLLCETIHSSFFVLKNALERF